MYKRQSPSSPPYTTKHARNHAQEETRFALYHTIPYYFIPYHAGFDAERHGVFFLDLECPLARLPHSSYAYRSPGHRHLPGGPDLANAILLRFLARVNK